MTKRLNLATLAALVLGVFTFTTNAIAGPTPGDVIVINATTDIDELVTDVASDADGIADLTIAKLNLLAKNKATTEERLTAEANKGLAKIERLSPKAINKTNSIARKAFVRIANLDEAGLIDQITDVDTARDDALDDIDGATADASAAIADALDAILNPEPEPKP